MPIPAQTDPASDRLPLTSRPHGRPSRDAAAVLPGRILASARALFLAQGFTATSVQQIAERAGAAKRTLYVKIGDKEALFRAVVSDMLQDWRDTVAATGPSGALQARLEHIGTQLLAVLLAPDMLRLNRVLLSEAYRFPALVQMLVEQVERGPIPQLARLLMEARGGTGVPARDDEVAARLLYEMVTGAPLRAALVGRPPRFAIAQADWVRQSVAVFLHGWPARAGGPDLDTAGQGPA